jgi:hypothetical protein
MQKHHYELIVSLLAAGALLLLLFKEQVPYALYAAMTLVAVGSYLSIWQGLSFKSFVKNKPLSRFLGYIALLTGILANFFEWVPEQSSFIIMVIGAALVFGTFDSPTRRNRSL